MSIYLIVSVILLGVTAEASTLLDHLSDEFIERINSNQSLWKAGRNFHRDVPLIYLKRLAGSLKDNVRDHLPEMRYKNLSRKVKNFDARIRWPYCPTLRYVRDQGSCGSCWAVSAAAAMTDRVCVASRGRKNFYFSEDDVLSCCTNCGAGCDGGVLSSAWLYSRINGTVSGGSFHSRYGCKPYEIAPCEHDVPGYRPMCGYHVNTPRCQKVCQKGYLKTYTDDQKRIGIVYKLKTINAIQRDMVLHGPVTTMFDLYTDFLHYKSGIYKHIEGDYMGAHSIKLLGWGEYMGIKYWLAANSWNSDWGEKGFFKILRGENHCQIEANAVAGDVIP